MTTPTDNRTLSESEYELVQKVFADPLSIPASFKTWLVRYLEQSDIFLMRGNVQQPVRFVPGESTLNVVIESTGAPISTGVKGDVKLEAAYTIAGWTLLADTSGNIAVDIWRDVLGNYPPVVGDSITGGNPPALVGQDHAQDTSLTGWTTTLNGGDTLRFNVNSVSAISRVCLALALTPR